jgi:hypothetical protein
MMRQENAAIRLPPDLEVRSTPRRGRRRPVVRVGNEDVAGAAREAISGLENGRLSTEPCGGAAVTLKDYNLEPLIW